jgi:hypothetical protein
MDCRALLSCLPWALGCGFRSLIECDLCVLRLLVCRSVATDFLTTGDELVSIFGKNMGPTISSLAQVYYRNSRVANASVFHVNVSRCVMVVPHESIR